MYAQNDPNPRQPGIDISIQTKMESKKKSLK